MINKSETASFITNYATSIAESTSSKLPPFFKIFVNLLFMQTPFGKAIDAIKAIAEKKK